MLHKLASVTPLHKLASVTPCYTSSPVLHRVTQARQCCTVTQARQCYTVLHKLASVTPCYTSSPVLRRVIQAHQSKMNVDSERVHDSNLYRFGTDNPGTFFHKKVLDWKPWKFTTNMTTKRPEGIEEYVGTGIDRSALF